MDVLYPNLESTEDCFLKSHPQTQYLQIATFHMVVHTFFQKYRVRWGEGGVTAQMPLYVLLFLLLQTLLHVHEHSIYSERLFMAIKYHMLSAEDGGFPLFLLLKYPEQPCSYSFNTTTSLG